MNAQDKIENVYMAIANKQPWDENEQIYLGRIRWSAAVNIAKSQRTATRLSNSSGYNNQGYYFQPEKSEL